jgi:hypothetical protein
MWGRIPKITVRDNFNPFDTELVAVGQDVYLPSCHT